MSTILVPEPIDVVIAVPPCISTVSPLVMFEVPVSASSVQEALLAIVISEVF